MQLEKNGCVKKKAYLYLWGYQAIRDGFGRFAHHRQSNGIQDHSAIMLQRIGAKLKSSAFRFLLG